MATRKDGKGRVLRKGECYRNSDGRYTYHYTDPFGKRRFIYAKTLSELREKEEELIKCQMDGLDYYIAGTADINYLFDRYISTKSELRETTKANYSYMYDRFIRKEFGKRKLDSIKYSDIVFFYTHLINEKGLQLNTLETVNTILHPTFELAVRDDVLRKNPTNGAYAELKKRKGGIKKTRRALTVEQQRSFINYVSESPIFYIWYPLFSFLLGTGCRIGEAVGIRWEDIDLNEEIIDINHSLTYYTRESSTYRCEFRVSKPKTEAGYRSIPMMQRVYDVLCSEYERQSEEGFCTSVIDGMTNFIFTNRNGQPHNPAAINRAIKRIVDAHNAEEEIKAKKQKRKVIMLPRFSCHVFRHTFASRLCENETNIKVIQQIMGHADVSTTMNIYAEVNEETTKISLSKLSKKLDVF